VLLEFVDYLKVTRVYEKRPLPRYTENTLLAQSYQICGELKQYSFRRSGNTQTKHDKYVYIPNIFHHSTLFLVF
jgi:hypothetical protein